jgi:hypothetical protein
MKLRSTLALSAALFAVTVAGTAEAGPRLNLDTEVSTAAAVQRLYTKRDFRGWRLAQARQLLRLDRPAPEDLDVLLTAYRNRVVAAGVDGLEGLVASALAALAAQGSDGLASARAHADRLAEGYRVVELSTPRLAMSHLRRAHTGYASALPVGMTRNIVRAQLRTYRFDPDDALLDTYCKDAGYRDILTQYGPEREARMRRICEGQFSDPAAGGMGPGALPAADELSCALSHAPTRTEHMEGLRDACTSALIEQAGGSENPLAVGAASWGMVELLESADLGLWPQRPFDEDKSGTTVDADGTRHQIQRDAGGTIVYSVSTSDTEIRYAYYDDFGYVVGESWQALDGNGDFAGVGGAIIYDRNGNVIGSEEINGNTYYRVETTPEGDRETHGHFEDSTRVIDSITNTTDDGTPTSSVRFNADGSVTVVTYDEAGQPAAVHTGAPADATMPDQAGLPPTECVDFLFELQKGQSFDAFLASGHDVPPSLLYPSPDAEPIDGGGLECLQIPAGVQFDRAARCGRLVTCPLGQLPDENCRCIRTGVGLPAADECAQVVLCVSGRPALDARGQCVCEENEADLGPIWVDPMAGSGPRDPTQPAGPEPVGSPVGGLL